MKLITKNKAAYSDYEIIDTYDTGIVLQGHEVKSIKGSHVNIKDAIITLQQREFYITNMDVPLYERTSPKIAPGYTPKGPRKLLLTAKERTKIVAKTTKTGYTIIPLEVYVALRGRIKLKIGVGRLLKKVEKKGVIKERDLKRDMAREVSLYR